MEGPQKDFHHPYKPYDIQFALMQEIYECISKGQVGIFESPTGTGKSLSLLCGSLTWLREHHDAALGEDKDSEDNEEPDWVVSQAQEHKGSIRIGQKQDLEDRLMKIRAKERKQKESIQHSQHRAKKAKLGAGSLSLANDESYFVLDDYNSDDESGFPKASTGRSKEQVFSDTNMKLMEKLGISLEPSSAADELQLEDETKIFYCSRTHSQLTQFVQEIRRVKLPVSSWAVESKGKDSIDQAEGHDSIKHLTLGSRKNLCINPSVSGLSSATAINERCLELQQKDTPQDHKCPFVPKKETEALVNDFRDHAIAKVRDIEDLGQLGKNMGICPYYSSRAAIKPSEVVTLPYPLMLQKSAREALNFSLKGHVVIIDEAHNLMDAINNIYSIGVSLSQLKRCRAQLGIYLQKFRNRLKGKNRVYITQIVRLLDSISGYLQGRLTAQGPAEGLVNVSELTSGKGCDQINLHKLMQYLFTSKLARKVEGYVDFSSREEPQTEGNSPKRTIPVLTHVQSFLEALTNPAAEGRFFYERSEQQDMTLRYMLLDPSQHFREIVQDARAVILAGGTMSPMDDYTKHLFPYVMPERLRVWSCGHIIPKENLIALPVSKGLGDIDFDFTFEKRNTPTLIDTLGISLLNVSRVVPDGVVVFFPSYAYLEYVVDRWQRKPLSEPNSIWDRLSDVKSTFLERKETPDTETLLTLYTAAVSSSHGALLFAIIGGKLSEGINFSDALGRCIVVVGLPFPNAQSPAWKAKLEYITESAIARGQHQEAARMAAREFYENACMRAVNQCIGRAIRHKADYASIVLLDKRYQTERIQKKLPDWIRQGIVKDGCWGAAAKRLEWFFKGKEDGRKG